MGCVSSKLIRQQQQQCDREVTFIVNHGGYSNNNLVHHVVSLTSSTYGLLNLDDGMDDGRSKTMSWRLSSPPRAAPEIINAWELMEGLEDGIPLSMNLSRKSPRQNVAIDTRSPLKSVSQVGSPRKVKAFGGKENKRILNGVINRVSSSSDISEKSVLKPHNSVTKLSKNSVSSRISGLESPHCVRGDSLETVLGVQSRRKNFSSLFDPELLAFYEKELCQETEEIKKMISPSSKTRKVKSSADVTSVLLLFERKCPPGGEKSVVLYTTTLRGIRKTFEDCNKVRSIIESHQIKYLERDVSMDSGLKEELRGLMDSVRVPVLFVKGRLIGGVDQVVKLEEEGKLEVLFDGVPRASLACCEGCGGIRFVMCMQCNGSCKKRDENKKSVKCGECNENGLIKCPICC